MTPVLLVVALLQAPPEPKYDPDPGAIAYVPVCLADEMEFFELVQCVEFWCATSDVVYENECRLLEVFLNSTTSPFFTQHDRARVLRRLRYGRFE